MKKMLFGVLFAALTASSAFAVMAVEICKTGREPLCAPTFNVMVQQLDSMGQPVGDPSTYVLESGVGEDGKTYVGQYGMDVGGKFNLAGVAASNSDPWVEYALGVKNITGGPLAFMFVFSTPFVGGPYGSLQSSYSSSVTDGSPTNGSITVTPGAAFIHTPKVDGTAHGELDAAGCALAGAPGFSGTCFALSDIIVWIPTTGAFGTLSIELKFILSPGDLISVNGRAEIFPVPEPVSTALVGAGLMVVALASRRFQK
ncbi:MAG: PEP-CTERM sorting domain-containing protein [Acidobacteria bacterium]|nr:PEP-CTERM sorting domain-containing protein [Acidobacteriota bacterium]